MIRAFIILVGLAAACAPVAAQSKQQKIERLLVLTNSDAIVSEVVSQVGGMMQQIQPMMPRLMDTFQTYLRELRPDDLKGTSGLGRARIELLNRVNAATNPTRVVDVLFLDGELTVVKVIEDFKPWRLSPWVWRSRSVLELPGGSLKGSVSVGDRILID